MPVFDFGEGPSQANSRGNPGTLFTFQETEGGVTVTFTLSTSNTGSNTASATIGGSGMPGALNLFVSGGIGDVFTLTARTSGGDNVMVGPVNLSIGATNDPWQIEFVGATSNAVQAAPPIGPLADATGQITAIRFTHTGTNEIFPLVIRSLSIDSFACFTADTRIAVPGAEVRVEDLAEGDLVLTADRRSVPVTWVGSRVVDTRFSDPAAVNPIRIAAGALGPGLPERDLLVSDDHALLVDGMLVEAGALVNGTTITREAEMLQQFTYYHVETEAHEVLLANGAPAESFIDYAGAGAFDNASERSERLTQEMGLPRVSNGTAFVLPDLGAAPRAA